MTELCGKRFIDGYYFLDAYLVTDDGIADRPTCCFEIGEMSGDAVRIFAEWITTATTYSDKPFPRFDWSQGGWPWVVVDKSSKRKFLEMANEKTGIASGRIEKSDATVRSGAVEINVTLEPNSVHLIVLQRDKAN